MAVPTDAEALDLMYRASTTGVSNAELAKFGGYAEVKRIAQEASFDATPTFVQSYEQSNALPASASTIANQQFIGTGGQERFQQQEADLTSSDAALAALTRQRIADQFAAAQATVAARQQAELGAARQAQIVARGATNTGTSTGTTGTVQPITRPPPVRQVTGTQFAPAAVTNTAITGTPFNNIYQPSTMQQNAPLLSDIQAAAQSANPYASLMSLTPQRTLSPAYAAQAGLTTYNTNLGGYDSSLNNAGAGLLAPSTIVGGGGTDLVNNSGDQRGPGTNNTASNIDPLAVGMARVANLFSSPISLTRAPVIDAAFNLTDAGRAAANAATIAGFGGSGDGQGGGGGGDYGGPGGAGFGGGSQAFAKGGKVNMRPQRHNPPGPDDGYAALDNGEYVIRKSAVKKYGSNIFEQINAGKIPAQRLKSLLE